MISRCNEGTIVDGAVNNPRVNNPNRTGCNVIDTINVLNFRKFKANCSSQEMLHQIK